MNQVISHFRVATDLDVLPLQRALLRQPWLFGQDGERKGAYGSAHSCMTDIWLRYNPKEKYLRRNNFAGFNDEHDSQWYPAYYQLPQVRSIIFKLMELVEGERLGGVLITKLAPGESIDTHQDFGWHAAYYDKYYIPLQNAEGATFNFPDGKIEPKLGEAYWFENSIPHGVTNNSSEDRIALIVCIRSDSTKGAYRPQPAPTLSTTPIHHFSAGVNALELKLPAGHRACSHKHNYDHMSILAQGEVVVTVDGCTSRFIAPTVVTITAGKVHEIIAIEDSVWFCIHPAESLDSPKPELDDVIIAAIEQE